ncbi:type II toxin-antitoxin system VapB family antitoxin [Methylobacterium sp. ID0610]|uniref:type II toxin-antitoxin system VapB family antitoxin n=1 Tax=Methylobacterium carpenticola TaxID=3344827 RepID=UPI00369E537C
MPLNIRSEEVNRLAETLASVARVSKTEAVRIALENEIQRREQSLCAFRARIRPIQDALAAASRTGLRADKAFFDELSGEI